MDLNASDEILMSGRSLRQILCSARILLTNPEYWSVGAPARTKDGTPVKPQDPLAARWCVEGAVAVCANPMGIIPPSVLRHLDAVAACFLGPDPMHTAGFLNDHSNHQRLLEYLDYAIAAAPQD